MKCSVSGGLWSGSFLFEEAPAKGCDCLSSFGPKWFDAGQQLARLPPKLEIGLPFQPGSPVFGLRHDQARGWRTSCCCG